MGLDRGVFYPPSGDGEAWNGLTSVVEEPSDSDENRRYVDGVQIDLQRRLGYFSGSIEAYTYPDSFYDDILAQHRPTAFGLCYRVLMNKGYKLHIVYNVLVKPAEAKYQTNGSEPFSWNFTSLPVPIPGNSRSSHLIVDSNVAYPWAVAALEDILYGSESGAPRLPTPTEIFDVFENSSVLQVIDNEDGSFTIIGPDEAVVELDPTTFSINWPSVVQIDAHNYTISSL